MWLWLTSQVLAHLSQAEDTWLLTDSTFCLPEFSLVFQLSWILPYYSPKSFPLLINGNHIIQRGIQHQWCFWEVAQNLRYGAWWVLNMWHFVWCLILVYMYLWKIWVSNHYSCFWQWCDHSWFIVYFYYFVLFLHGFRASDPVKYEL